MALTALVTLILAVNALFIAQHGVSGFSSLKFDGPHKVGVRHLHLKTKGTEVTVFYPIDENEYACKINTHNTPYLKRPKEWFLS